MKQVNKKCRKNTGSASILLAFKIRHWIYSFQHSNFDFIDLAYYCARNYYATLLPPNTLVKIWQRYHKILGAVFIRTQFSSFQSWRCQWPLSGRSASRGKKWRVALLPGTRDKWQYGWFASPLCFTITFIHEWNLRLSDRLWSCPFTHANYGDIMHNWQECNGVSARETAISLLLRREFQHDRYILSHLAAKHWRWNRSFLKWSLGLWRLWYPLASSPIRTKFSVQNGAACFVFFHTKFQLDRFTLLWLRASYRSK